MSSPVDHARPRPDALTIDRALRRDRRRMQCTLALIERYARERCRELSWAAPRIGERAQ